MRTALERIGGNTGEEFEAVIRRMTKRFFSPLISRKTLYTRLQEVRPLPPQIDSSVLLELEDRKLLIVLSPKPLRVLITPFGVLRLFSTLYPARRFELLDKLVQHFETMADEKVRLAIEAFEGAVLSWKEIGAMLFLLYNDSTSPERGQYVRTVELWSAIDRIVQAFVQGSATASATPHLDGAPGRWYLGEANRKLGNAVNIRTGSYYVRPQAREQVFDELRQSLVKLGLESARERFREFEAAFTRDKAVLAREGVLFATSESISRCRNLFRGDKQRAKDPSKS